DFPQPRPDLRTNSGPPELSFRPRTTYFPPYSSPTPFHTPLPILPFLSLSLLRCTKSLPPVSLVTDSHSETFSTVYSGRPLWRSSLVCSLWNSLYRCSGLVVLYLFFIIDIFGTPSTACVTSIGRS